jgi:hypothetical protein
MTIAPRLMVVGVLALALGAGCGGKVPEVTETGGDTETGIPSFETGDGPATSRGTAADTSVGGGGATSSDPSADSGNGSDGPGATEGTTGGGGGGNAVDCGGTTYACGDGLDNDGDGFFDLFDPECTGPCDDDESSFQTGIPGDNMDCKQDCFFDGNSGQGDDGCIWDLRCDPANPGEFIGCEYTGGNNCNNQPPNQEQGCIEFCEPFVPPGCDCFGCCTVQTPEGPIDIFLNSDPECSLDNLDACTMCTSQIDDCGTPCVPEDCQVCFGETEPPEGCDGNMCPSGDPCDADSPDSCPMDFFCYLGCCYPPPPG